jgi:hypothetical protein
MSCLKTVLAVLLLFQSIISAFGAECGDSSWQIYNNEKCFKIVDQVVNKDTAVALCAAEIGEDRLTPELLTIKNLAEQEFVTKFVYGGGTIFDNVWLGAERAEDGSFYWDKDRSKVVYTNWAEDHPTDNESNDCLQITSHVSRDQNLNVEDGQWKDVPCIKRNLVVCQKRATLSIAELQDLIYEVRNNPVPIGFLYTQFPKKPNPQSIWPNLMWRDVTSEYAGLFFRAGGGAAAAFGEIQPESTKRLKTIASRGQREYGEGWNPVSINPGGWTTWIRMGHYGGVGGWDYATHMKFEATNDEIKPRNTAVLIWERIQ